jgi:hypothetical protein
LVQTPSHYSVENLGLIKFFLFLLSPRLLHLFCIFNRRSIHVIFIFFILILVILGIFISRNFPFNCIRPGTFCIILTHRLVCFLLRELLHVLGIIYYNFSLPRVQGLLSVCNRGKLVTMFVTHMQKWVIHVNCRVLLPIKHDRGFRREIMKNCCSRHILIFNIRQEYRITFTYETLPGVKSGNLQLLPSSIFI